MAIPPGSLQTEFDFQNPACFTNGGTAITDLSGNGNNFTLNNTSYTFDNTYGSILFPSGTYADGTPSDYAFGTAAFSVLAWVKFNTSVPGINVFHFGGSGTGQRTAFLWRSSDNLIVVDNAGSAGAWDQTADNEWHLLAITRPSSAICNQQKVYLDGVLIAFSSSAFNPTQPLNATLGAARIHDTSFGSADLELATFDVYTAELSAGDITTLYNDTKSRFIVPTVEYDFSDPVCYPGTGNTVFDLSGNNINGTKQSGATYVGAGQSSYFQFNGTSSAYITSSVPTSGLSAFTLNIWCQPENSSTENVALSFGNDGPGTIPFIDYSSFTPEKFLISNGFGIGTTEANVTSPINSWCMVSYTYEANDCKLYINGNLAGTASGTVSVANPSPLRLGGYSPNIPNNFTGRIGIARVYTAALGSTAISDLYNADVSRFEPPIVPVASYDVSNPASYSGTGNTLYDLSANSYDITLTNTPAYITYDNFKSLQFLEASSQFGQYSGSVGINTTTPEFTFSTWLKPISLSPETYNVLIGYGKETGPSTGGAAMILNKFLGSNELVPTFGSGKADIRTGDPVALGTWVNLVTTSDGTTYKVYVNGVFIDSTPLSGAQIGTPEYIRINGLPDNTPLKGNFELATLDIYTEALDAGTILQNYDDTKNQYVLPTVEYDFQNGSYPGTGTTITDLQGGNTNLTIGNGHWVSGAPNYFDLQGDTNLFNTSPGGSFSSTTFTVNCWYNPLYTNPATYASVWSLGIDGNPTSPILSTNSDGTLNIQWSFGYGLVGTTVTNDWHLISFVSNGSTTTLYVDGISIGSAASSSGTVASPYTIRLGSGSTSSTTPRDYAYGKIGYWSYFDVALDAAQVLDLYNATSGSYLPPPPPSSNGVGGRQFAQGFNG